MDRPLDLTTVIAALESDPAQPSSDYDLSPDVALATDRVLRPAAVLIGVINGDVILTKRASTLKHHPGQIAFPGGKLDGEETAAEAALREAHEEIGLDAAHVQILATLPPHETVTSYTVTPVLAQITKDFVATPEVGEVAEVFRVPLSFLLNPSNYIIEGRHWRGVRREFFTVPYGPYYIWGATARILKSLAEKAT